MPGTSPCAVLQPLVFRPREAAKMINRSESWLAQRRCYGGGPKFIKAGQVYYQLADLEEWIAAQGHFSATSEYAKGRAAC